MPTARYPQLYKKFLRYKRNFTNDVDRKSRHYDLVRGIVQTPLLAVYEHVRQIPWRTLPERFVLKADVGTGATRVKCLKRVVDDVYLDLLRRNKPRVSRGQLVEFFDDKGQVLLERYLYDPAQGEIPFDVKIFVAYDEVLYFRIINRNTVKTGVAMLNGRRKRIPHSEFFLPGYRFKPETDPLPFSEQALQRASSLATMVGTRLKTPFISVDMYIINDADIYLGELTWAPGPLVYTPMQPGVVDSIYMKILEKERVLNNLEGSLVWRDSR